jgi:hypothetical protein
MLDYILGIETFAVSAGDFKKKKSNEVKYMYEILKAMNPDEEGEDGEDGEECEEE